MASLRHVRRRLRSIHNTKQIMRAMQLVSASKLKRAQTKLMQARSVLEFLDGLLFRALNAKPQLKHVLCESHADGPCALVIFTSDAGLCGSYNTNLIQLAEAHLRRDSLRRTQLIYIGKKGYRYFTRRGYPAAQHYIDLAGRPNVSVAQMIARKLLEIFLSKEVSSVELLYSRFISSASFRPTILKWLPIQFESASAPMRQFANAPTRQPANAIEYIFEPSTEAVFEDLLPRWALAKFQLVMLEAFTSEHSARMIAMKNATDNAEHLLKSLTLQRNKMRQAAITKELSEIGGTAEALK